MVLKSNTNEKINEYDRKFKEMQINMEIIKSERESLQENVILFV